MKDDVDILLSFDIKTKGGDSIVLGRYHSQSRPISIEIYISGISAALEQKKKRGAWDNIYSHVVSHEVIHEVLHRVEGFATCVQFDNIAGVMSLNPKEARIGLNVKLTKISTITKVGQTI